MAGDALPMREPLRSEVLDRLCGQMGFKVKGLYLQNGECPACGKREMYTSVEGPWRLQCGRLNKCGAAYHIKELLPELFETWTERYGRQARERAKAEGRPVDPVGADSATPVADAYLEIGRGFELSRLEGWYTQDTYFDEALNAGTTTVRFPLPNGFWERLLDKPERFGRQKARAVGPYKGLWWAPPGVSLTAARELWITEGIFDAIALLHAGRTAVSTISCNNYPESALAALAEACGRKDQRPRLVFAYDGDRAGSKYTRTFCDLAERAGWTVAAAVIPPRKGGAKRWDWNDAWQRGELTDKHLAEYRYHGSLLIATGYRQKGDLICEHTKRRAFWYEHYDKLYWYELDSAKYEKALAEAGIDPSDRDAKLPLDDLRDIMRRASAIKRICNCAPQALYYMSSPILDEAWYYWSVRFPRGHVVKNTLTASQQASPAEFKKRLMHIAPGAIWEGTATHLDALLGDQITDIKRVETIDYIGYSREHDTWLWGDIAVHGGRLYRINEQDHFDIGRTALKTLAQGPVLHINADRDAYTTAWAPAIWQAYGALGVICLAYWLGSLFAEQIRERHKSFPFLELVGEAGSGKSTLLEFLWKLVGRRDYEGFDPVKSTLPGRARNFSQVGNLPVVLIESDREKDAHAYPRKQFDWDELKTAFNGRSVRARGMRTGGNDTYEPPFRGSIVISQNAPVNASEPILTRIVQVYLSRDNHTAETKRLAETLERAPLEQVSGFAAHAAMRADKLLALIDARAGAYEAELAALDTIRILRIAKTHGQVAALIDCLGPEGLGLLPANACKDAVDQLFALAQERQRTVNADHPFVQEFWETVEYLEGLGSAEAELNHYGGREPNILAINLKHFETVCAEFKLRPPSTNELKRHLKSSRTRKYIESNRSVRSVLFNGRTVRCWIFEA